MSQPVSEPVSDRADLVKLLDVAITPDLLELALTHRSFAYENGGIGNNERLEFLGDSILGQAVTVMLFRENPDLDEGDLAKRRASLVSTVALAEVAKHIGLGQYLRLGRGEELTGGRAKQSILADTVEAIIGATYLDAGPVAATGLVMRLIAPLLADPERFGAAMDPKTSLQELASAQGRSNPNYVITDSGPDHDKRFHAVVRLGTDEIASGVGSSKKMAEMAAALEAWTTLSTPPSAPDQI
ncbi:MULTISPECIES: ribonuclease III [unclassified Frondihabitans]|jgi:ribonuclease-3|uniref:ribonuclease III n=1 Tax=unclassified Frondihabitans TaxID=2626248 RepID=UPI0006F2F8DF|nr:MULTISPECIES: ribonuclease III [unclassified Frondihabitans]KQQ27828.1 ribonuclease III [Frondihabitans sp. Leaf304]RPE74406.1 RNAse III [Frondihabitans sp. PhB153]RPF02835.1 RNAse III [Frondihabitans sp. PhB161]